MAARRSSVMTRVSVITPSCTVPAYGSPSGRGKPRETGPGLVTGTVKGGYIARYRLTLTRYAAVRLGRGAGLRVGAELASQPVEVGSAAVVHELPGHPGDHPFPPGLLELERGGPGGGLGLARLAAAGRAAPAPVDQQAVNRVRHPVEGGAHRGQPAERVPFSVRGKEDLEDHAVLGVVPFVIERPVGDRRFGELVLVGVPPPAGRELVAGKDLDGPPFSHLRRRHPALHRERSLTRYYAFPAAFGNAFSWRHRHLWSQVTIVIYLERDAVRAITPDTVCGA